MQLRRESALVMLSILAFGCEGSIGDTRFSPVEDDPIEPPADPCAERTVGPSPMRRLTHAEYDHAVRDLLGVTSPPSAEFEPDVQVGIFDNDVSAQLVAELMAERYLDTAAELAEGVTDIAALAGCDPATDDTCLPSFLARFGRRAFRRPLTEDETARLGAIYDDVRARSDVATGVRATIAALLASPNFLFRPEFGDGPSEISDASRLGPYELAARLSFLLWASIPDDALLDRAAAGELETRDAVAEEARRMLDDPRARPAIGAFYEQWFALARIDTTEKDPDVYSDFTDELRGSMHEETRRFVDHVLWDGDARLETLLSAPYSFVNAPLASLYGVSGPADAATFERVMLDPSERAGILTHAGFLASFAHPDQSSPVKRGEFVRRRLLCRDLPAPPDDVPPLPEIMDGVSNRERNALHSSAEGCRGCHDLIDGLGFGLEAYDGIGRFREIDQGVAVDDRGEITETRDIDGEYEGGPELAQRLASSAHVRDCATTQWLRYASGRREQTADLCVVRTLQSEFEATGGDLRELMVMLTQTDAFWHYRAE